MISRVVSRRRKTRSHHLPNGVRIYAIGDVHGRADLLDHVLSRVEAHAVAHPIVRPVILLIGDYIDRGPDSRATIDLLVNCSQGREVICLQGNHDLFINNFLQNPAILRDWGALGGLETLISYGLKPPINADARVQKELAEKLERTIPTSHRLFFNNLIPSFTCGGYFFVHAGIRPGIPLNKQKEGDLLWIRDDFLLCEDDFGKIVIHGHTPVHDIDIRHNRINIDTGAYATGRLSCLVLEGERAEPLSL